MKQYVTLHNILLFAIYYITEFWCKQIKKKLSTKIET